MNQLANPNSSRRSLVTALPSFARLDPADAGHRFIRDVITRSHAGRWPLWRALGMRWVGSLLYEAAAWLPRRPGARPRFTLLRWDPAARGLSWQDLPSKKAAITALRALR
jgi:hypothetical protein